ncbi:hypothetical protein FQR65_LT07364 [Abscondita terminalis]|nr:hypothetical protein FQR65_LT07364 [Abscondita terminalis]
MESSSANPFLLLHDHHESHLNVEALDSTKKFWANVLTLRNPDHLVLIYGIGQFIGTAFTKSTTIQNITKTFRNAGIVLFHNNDILPSVDTDPTLAVINPNPAVP